MNNEMEALRRELDEFSSGQAVDWLMSQFPVDGADCGVAVALLPHRSWRRVDQIRLARHCLRGMPFSTHKVYEVFASFMSVGLLVDLVDELIPSEGSDVNLVLYYLIPVLDGCVKSDADRERVKSFVLKHSKAF